jgi:hypothetical protein
MTLNESDSSLERMGHEEFVAGEGYSITQPFSRASKGRENESPIWF